MIGFDWVSLGISGCYWVLLGFTGFYWVVQAEIRGSESAGASMSNRPRVDWPRWPLPRLSGLVGPLPSFVASDATAGRLPSFYRVFCGTDEELPSFDVFHTGRRSVYRVLAVRPQRFRPVYRVFLVVVVVFFC